MKVRLIKKLLDQTLQGACEACMPRTHEELLADHKRRRDRQLAHNERHAQLFVPR